MKFSLVNICPKCKSRNTTTYHLNHKIGTNHRTRACHDCGYRWSTIEINEVEFDKLCDAIEMEVHDKIEAETIKRIKKAINEMEF